jgi:hypothetical protein
VHHEVVAWAGPDGDRRAAQVPARVQRPKSVSSGGESIHAVTDVGDRQVPVPVNEPTRNGAPPLQDLEADGHVKHLPVDGCRLVCGAR